MYYKKILCLLFAGIVAMLFSVGLAATDRDAILTQIYEYCNIELGYDRDGLTLNNLEHYKDGSWAFSFFVKDPEPKTNALVTGSINKDGTLKSIQGPAPVSTFEWLCQETGKALFDYKDVYRLKKEWEPQLAFIPDEELKAFNASREYYPLLDFLRHDIVLPDEKCIDYDTAKENSIHCIEAMKGWTPKMTKHIDLIAETVHIPSGMDHPVYQFIYTTASTVAFQKNVLFNEEYTDDFNRKVSRMMDDEDIVFGDNLPSVISVRIDAYSGAQVGEIYLETPPVSGYDYIAMILWE